MDAFLLISYGAPECREDVRPFLNNILDGKPVPPRHLERIIERYERLATAAGAFSPLPGECRALIAGLAEEFRRTNATDPDRPILPIYWGNLFWKPFLAETLAEMSRNGIRRAVAFATNAFPSEPDGGKYAIHLQSACRSLASQGHAAPECVLVPPCWEHPMFIDAVADRILESLAQKERKPDDKPPCDPPGNGAETCLVFTAHSVPECRGASDVYDRAVREACRRAMERVGGPGARRDGASVPTHWELAYQSRSGRPGENWLGPELDERLDALGRDGRFGTVLLVPIGFFCENMETAYDLDIAAAGRCKEFGLRFARAQTVAGLPTIPRMIHDLILPRLDFQ